MRFRRFLPLLAALTLLLGVCGQGRAAEAVSVSVAAEEVRPGKAAVIRYVLPEGGSFSLRVLGPADRVLAVIAEDRPAEAGGGALYWNGTWNGLPLPAGTWRLVLTQGESRAEVPVTVGALAPTLIRTEADRPTAVAGEQVTFSFWASAEGTLSLRDGSNGRELASAQAEQGYGSLTWTAAEPEGQRQLLLTLTEASGTVSDPVPLALTVYAGVDPEETGAHTDSGMDPEEESASETIPWAPTEPASETNPDGVFTPSWSSPYAGQDTSLNYWTLPMDISDERAVWQVLMQPITVVDNGKRNAEKTQVVIHAAPSEESGGVGVVTCVTQGVHVLERGDEWSLIECYSSSFHDSPILNWNALIQGYVPTAFLKETEPNPEYGIVIDKLTQRLYLFREGRLLSTLMVSTGLANPRQPYNETRSGEFLLTSAVGTFASDNLRCALAIRFNRGDLLHEVPYIVNADGSQNYKSAEAKLGKKASHGCIRVQRKLTPEGINQAWLWNNRMANTKLLIWEDWQGRQIPVPPDDLPLYYNPSGGQYYHSEDHCSMVQRKNYTFRSFTYGQLDEKSFSKLKRCEYCAPVLRKAEIEQINEAYAFGGDHDPVMTEARKKCPRKLKGK